MEIAEAFATAAKDGIKPRRSILFLNVTGEEKGLLGSEYYSENPVFPIANTVNNINIDMVGRIDYEYQK
jgi:Zn-dependent M28 family amino/carboxypeptidase